MPLSSSRPSISGAMGRVLLLALAASPAFRRDEMSGDAQLAVDVIGDDLVSLVQPVEELRLELFHEHLIHGALPHRAVDATVLILEVCLIGLPSFYPFSA